MLFFFKVNGKNYSNTLLASLQSFIQLYIKKGLKHKLRSYLYKYYCSKRLLDLVVCKFFKVNDYTKLFKKSFKYSNRAIDFYLTTSFILEDVTECLTSDQLEDEKKPHLDSKVEADLDNNIVFLEDEMPVIFSTTINNNPLFFNQMRTGYRFFSNLKFPILNDLQKPLVTPVLYSVSLYYNTADDFFLVFPFHLKKSMIDRKKKKILKVNNNFEMRLSYNKATKQQQRVYRWLFKILKYLNTKFTFKSFLTLCRNLLTKSFYSKNNKIVSLFNRSQVFFIKTLLLQNKTKLTYRFILWYISYNVQKYLT